MTLKTNVPSLIFEPQGANAPLESAILKGAIDDIDGAFGGGLNRNLETPQGQLASSLSAIIADKNNQIVKFANQIHPDYAEGLFQDAIAKIYFLERKQATQSTAECEIIGLSGATVPSGFLIKDQNGKTWRLTQSLMIGASGKISGNFVCTEQGAINAPANTINQIYQSVIGIDRVSNPLAAIPGQDQESRDDFAYRRQNSVALNSHGTPQSVYASVFDIEGVQDVFVYDNVKDHSIRYGATNYELAPHSIYVAIVGGDSEHIADAIWRKTGNGCNYNGNTEVTVYDKTYTPPYPEYKIKLMRPEQIPVFFHVLVENSQGFTNQSVDYVKKIIVNAFYGLDGSARERIGGHIHTTKYISALIAGLPGVHLMGVTISLDGLDQNALIELGIDQYGSVSEENIQVSYQ